MIIYYNAEFNLPDENEVTDSSFTERPKKYTSNSGYVGREYNPSASTTINRLPVDSTDSYCLSTHIYHRAPLSSKQLKTHHRAIGSSLSWSLLVLSVSVWIFSGRADWD